MPDIVQWLRLKGDSSGLQKSAKAAGESMTTSFAKAQIVTQALSKATEFLTSTIKDGAKAALENEKTTAKLTTALKIQGREISNNLAGLNAAASVQEELSGISDEVIRGYQAQAIALGKTATETDDLINASLALSQVTGRDVRTSFEALLKAETGVIEESTKLVPELANLTKEQLKAGDAVGVLNEKYSEFIALGTSGGYGALKRLENEFANVGEAVAMLGNEEDGFIVQLNHALADLFEWQRRILSDSTLSAFERLAFLFAPLTNPEASAEWQANLKRSEQYAREMLVIQEKIDAREGKGVPSVATIASPKGKKGGDSQDDIDDFRTEVNDSIIEREQKRVEQLLDNERRFQETKLQITEDADEKLAAYRESQNEYQLEMDRQYQRDAQFLQEQALAIEKENIKKNAENYKEISQITQRALGDAIGMLVTFAERGKFAADELAVGMLQGVGKELVGMGGAYILKGTARLFETRFSDPTAYGMIKTGGAMVAAGAALVGGASAAGRALDVGGARAEKREKEEKKQRESMAREAGQLATREREEGVKTRRGPETITIVFQGPTTPEGIGVAVHGALASAKSKGLI